jgi:hypothetical protein
MDCTAKILLLHNRNCRMLHLCLLPFCTDANMIMIVYSAIFSMMANMDNRIPLPPAAYDASMPPAYAATAVGSPDACLRKC